MRELGQGGMGKVYLAASPAGQEVAVKTVSFPDGIDARARWETVERFQREARAARALEHPRICQVLDIGADGDTFFIVLEYLVGKTLRNLIQDVGELGVGRSTEILLQVCEALAYAHDQGVIHRDIKPDNVMVLKDGEAKLMDFGLASIVHETGVTQTGTTMGTFPYMSPEQARGEKLDVRSDIFSLGSTFYEMLSGRQAFQGDGPAAIMNAVLNQDPPRIGGLPIHVSRTLAKCLRKQPPYRFQNVREITAALRAGDGQTLVRGTMVAPQTGPDATARPSPTTPPSRTGAQPAGALGSAPPQLRCPKCREVMAPNTATCWRCGTPNPVIARRKVFHETQSAISKALEGYKTPKKRGWLWRRK